MNSPYRLTPCPCRPYWTSVRSYTARCPSDRLGESVTVRRQAISYFSQQHADELALRLAKCEAERELNCYFEATQSWYTACTAVQPPVLITRTEQSKISYEDALAKALAAAQQAAENLCENGIEGGHLALALVEGGNLILMNGGKLLSAS